MTSRHGANRGGRESLGSGSIDHSIKGESCHDSLYLSDVSQSSISESVDSLKCDILLPLYA